MESFANHLITHHCIKNQEIIFNAKNYPVILRLINRSLLSFDTITKKVDCGLCSSVNIDCRNGGEELIRHLVEAHKIKNPSRSLFHLFDGSSFHFHRLANSKSETEVSLPQVIRTSNKKQTRLKIGPDGILNIPTGAKQIRFVTPVNTQNQCILCKKSFQSSEEVQVHLLAEHVTTSNKSVQKSVVSVEPSQTAKDRSESEDQIEDVDPLAIKQEDSEMDNTERNVVQDVDSEVEIDEEHFSINNVQVDIMEPGSDRLQQADCSIEPKVELEEEVAAEDAEIEIKNEQVEENILGENSGISDEDYSVSSKNHQEKEPESLLPPPLTDPIIEKNKNEKVPEPSPLSSTASIESIVETVIPQLRIDEEAKKLEDIAPENITEPRPSIESASNLPENLNENVPPMTMVKSCFSDDEEVESKPIVSLHVNDELEQETINLTKEKSPAPVESKTPNLQCPICHKVQTSILNFTTHMRRYHKDSEQERNKPFTCNICNHGFYFQSSLNSHKSKAHQETSGTTFKCPLCPSVTNSKNGMRRHLR